MIPSSLTNQSVHSMIYSMIHSMRQLQGEYFDVNLDQQCLQADMSEKQMKIFQLQQLTPKVETLFSSQTYTLNEALKSFSSSDGYRQEGNVYYKKQDYTKALELYTRSIACAPIGSSGLALAYGNRSAVLRAQGKFADCIADVRRAIGLGHPQLLSFKLLVREAQCHRDLGQPESAAQSFRRAEEIAEKNFSSASKRAEALELVSSERKAGPAVVAPRPAATLPQVPALSYGRSAEAPCASSAVAIQYSQQFGRHLVATRDIAIGDVLMVEEPLFAFPKQDNWYTHCTHCLQRCDTLLPCDTCTIAMFCSQQCKDVALDKYHRAECAVLIKYCAHLPFGNVERVIQAVRTIATLGMDQLISSLDKPASLGTDDQARRTRGFNADGQFVSGLDAYLSLAWHPQQSSQMGSGREYWHSVLMLKLFNVPLHGENTIDIFSLIYETIRINECNPHGIPEMEIDGLPPRENIRSKVIGIGLYTTGSLNNHSCIPNVIGVNYGRSKVTRAVRPIPKGKQLFECYGPLMILQPRAERLKTLLLDYNFECQCEACHSWPDKLPELPHLPQKTYMKLYPKLEKTRLKLNSGALLLLEDGSLELFKSLLTTLFGLGQMKNQMFHSIQKLLECYYRMQGTCYHPKIALAITQ